MRKYLIISCLLIVAGLLSGGCTQVLPPGDVPESESAEPLVEVVFTRATAVSAADEAAVGRWVVFVFDDTSGWYAWAGSDSPAPVVLNLRAGRDYTCYAVVNYPVSGAGALDPAAVRTPADLTERVARLGDNAPGALLMFGSSPVTPTGTTPLEHSIPVSRLVSRIDVAGIAVDFSGKPRLAAQTFTLRHIYITNTSRTTRYGGDYRYAELPQERSAWYNTLGWHRGEEADAGMDALLADRDIDAVLTPASPHTTVHSFYVFPNPTPRTKDRNELTSGFPRSTRIVLEATLGDDTVYYQISLPAMERNHIYTAQDIVIRGRGSNDPEIIEIDPDATSVTLLDDGWETRNDIYL